VLEEKLGISTALSKVPYELEGEFCEAMPGTEFTKGTFAALGQLVMDGGGPRVAPAALHRRRRSGA